MRLSFLFPFAVFFRFFHRVGERAVEEEDESNSFTTEIVSGAFLSSEDWIRWFRCCFPLLLLFASSGEAVREVREKEEGDAVVEVVRWGGIEREGGEKVREQDATFKTPSRIALQLVRSRRRMRRKGNLGRRRFFYQL